MEVEKLLTPLCSRAATALLSLHTHSSSFNYCFRSCQESLEEQPCCLTPFTTGGRHSEPFGLFIRPTLRGDTPPGNGSVSQRLNERQGRRELGGEHRKWERAYI